MTLTHSSAERKTRRVALRDMIDLNRVITASAGDAKAKWQTQKKFPFNYRKLVNAYTGRMGDPKVVGVSFGALTRHGLIDIDATSPNWRTDAAEQLLSTVRRLGFKCVWLRSSHSGGWHFLFTFSSWLDSGVVSGFLKKLAKAAGLVNPGKKGHCEVYPNVDVDQAVRLPFMWNQAVLGSVGAIDFPKGEMNELTGAGRLDRLYRAFSTKHSNPVLLVKQWTGQSAETWQQQTVKAPKAQTREESVALVGASGPVGEVDVASWLLPELPTHGWEPNPDVVAAYDYRSEHRLKGKRRKFNDPENKRGAALFALGVTWWESGLVSAGSRNEALLAVGFMLFMAGVKDADERAKLLITWLSQKHNGKSAEWRENPEVVVIEILRMAKWKPQGVVTEKQTRVRAEKIKPVRSEAEKKEIARGWNSNNKAARSASTLRVVAAAMLIGENSQPITYASVLTVSGVSKATLQKVVQSYKHLGLKLSDLHKCSEVREQFDAVNLAMMKELLRPNLAKLKSKPASATTCATSVTRASEKKTVEAGASDEDAPSQTMSKKSAGPAVDVKQSFGRVVAVAPVFVVVPGGVVGVSVEQSHYRTDEHTHSKVIHEQDHRSVGITSGVRRRLRHA